MDTLTVQELIEALQYVEDKSKPVQIVAWKDQGHPHVASRDDVLEGEGIEAPVQEFDDYVAIIRTP